MKNDKNLEKQILFILLKNYPEMKKGEIDYEYGEGHDLIEMTELAEIQELISFQIREDNTNSEHYLVCEYYSKIGKCVQFDIDVTEVYDNIKSFAEQLALYQKGIDKLENSIIINDKILRNQIETDMLDIYNIAINNPDITYSDIRGIIKTKIIKVFNQ